MLSAADIERWDPSAVREAADAAQARAQSCFDAASGLQRLPCFTSWGGLAASAAGQAIDRTRRDLEGQGIAASLIAAVSRRAADHIDGVKTSLFRLESEAVSLGLGVDLAESRIVGIRRGSEAAAAALQVQLNAVVVEANTVDAELAAGLGLDQAPVAPSLHRPIGAVPEDPAQFYEMWKRLSPVERDELYNRDHSIGNHPGMPTGGPDSFDADHYTRRHLAEALGLAQATNSPQLEDLRALDDMLAKNPDVRLMLLDTSGEQLHAAFAVGDPDNADHISVTTPGLNTTVAGVAAQMAHEAGVLQQLAIRQLEAASRTDKKVAAIAWIGYDAPQINTSDGLAGMLKGIDGVTHDGVAKAAAVDLARFYDGVSAAHGGKPLDLTAIGHSYGSLTTGLALQQPGNHGVDKAIFYGSPGIEASAPAQLHLQPGQVFAMEAPDDTIQLVYDGPLAKAVAPVFGLPGGVLTAWAEMTDAGEFGPNPATNPNFIALETGASSASGIPLAEAHGHSDYPRPVEGPNGSWLPRTTNYNIAAVVAGMSNNWIAKK
jgi:hypothetical protein